MKEERITNVAASVRQRLANLARERGEPFEFVLGRYGAERLLYRLSRSKYAGEFILKGAALFQVWSGQPHRATRDVDLHGEGQPSTERFAALFAEVCGVEVEDDSLQFLPDSVRAEPIKEQDEYQGIRVKLQGRLQRARVSLQVDIGFGDAVTPAALEIDYPTLLGQPAPRLRAYPRETVVAEKYQAMVALGMANSRMKDFYDLWTLATMFAFEGPLLCEAIRATFARRQTDLPAPPPLALTAEFYEDAAKARQWTAFLLRSGAAQGNLTLAAVAEFLRGFLISPTEALLGNEPFPMVWQPAGPWRSA